MVSRRVRPPSSPLCRQRMEPVGPAVRLRLTANRTGQAKPQALRRRRAAGIRDVACPPSYFFIRSTPNRDRAKTARHGATPSQNEKSAGEKEKTARELARSVPGGLVVYRFLRRSETHFASTANCARRAAGNRRRVRRYWKSDLIRRAIRPPNPRLDEKAIGP